MHTGHVASEEMMKYKHGRKYLLHYVFDFVVAFGLGFSALLMIEKNPRVATIVIVLAFALYAFRTERRVRDLENEMRKPRY